MTNLEHIKSENIRRCTQQARLGHNDAALRLMGFADGCIREARRPSKQQKQVIEDLKARATLAELTGDKDG